MMDIPIIDSEKIVFIQLIHYFDSVDECDMRMSWTYAVYYEFNAEQNEIVTNPYFFLLYNTDKKFNSFSLTQWIQSNISDEL